MMRPAGCGAGWWSTIPRKKICAPWAAGSCGTGGRWLCIPIKTAYFTLPGRCSGRSSCGEIRRARSSAALWRNWGSSGSRRTRRRPKGESSGGWADPTGCVFAAATCRYSLARRRRDLQLLPAYGLQDLQIKNPNPQPRSKPNASPLPITLGGNLGSGHFYLAENRTFLLCVDKSSRHSVYAGEKGDQPLPRLPARRILQSAWLPEPPQQPIAAIAAMGHAGPPSPNRLYGLSWPKKVLLSVWSIDLPNLTLRGCPTLPLCIDSHFR